MSGHATVQAVVDTLVSLFAAEGIAAEIHLGARALPKLRDSRLGQIVIVPTTAVITGPRLTGTLPVAHYSVEQTLECHIVARAPKNEAFPERQYGDDLTQVEALRNVFLHIAERKIHGVKRGGTQTSTESGELTYGAGLVVSLTVVLDSTSVPYTPDAAPIDTVFVATCAAVMPSETVECCPPDPPPP